MGTLLPAERAVVKALLASSLTHDKIWSGTSWTVPAATTTERNDIKKRIKDFLLIKQEKYCYYCGFSFEFRNGLKGIRGIHLDHIAPKHNHRDQIFGTKNLILACSKCNSADYKGSKDTVLKKVAAYKDWEFSIIHPYLDTFSDHLQLYDDGSLRLVKSSSKGRATKAMFGLDESMMVQLRSCCLMFDAHEVDDLSELKIRRITKKNLTSHR